MISKELIIGATIGHLCSMLDKGLDPRKVEFPRMAEEILSTLIAEDERPKSDWDIITSSCVAGGNSATLTAEDEPKLTFRDWCILMKDHPDSKGVPLTAEDER